MPTVLGYLDQHRTCSSWAFIGAGSRGTMTKCNAPLKVATEMVGRVDGAGCIGIAGTARATLVRPTLE